MGLFNNEAEEREKRWAAEAEERAERYRSRAAEAELAAVNAQIQSEERERQKREEKEKKEKLKQIATSGRGDAILELLNDYEKNQDRYNAKKLMNMWQVPKDKENFELFAQTFSINYDYFTKLDWKTDDDVSGSETMGLRQMLIERGRRVAQIHLKGQVDDSLELLYEAEQRMNEKHKKELMKYRIIGIAFTIFLLLGCLIMWIVDDYR